MATAKRQFSRSLVNNNKWVKLWKKWQRKDVVLVNDNHRRYRALGCVKEGVRDLFNNHPELGAKVRIYHLYCEALKASVIFQIAAKCSYVKIPRVWKIIKSCYVKYMYMMSIYQTHSSVVKVLAWWARGPGLESWLRLTFQHAPVTSGTQPELNDGIRELCNITRY